MRTRTFLIFAAVWLLLLATSFYLQMREIKSYGKESAAKQAEKFFDSIVLLEGWSSKPDDLSMQQTPPNSALTAPKIDLETKDASKIAKSPVICLARQFANLANSKTGIRFHMVSLNPLQAANKPDAWEQVALEGMAKGEYPQLELDVVDGKSYYRYIHGWKIMDSCVSCHSHQIARVGENYGGVSIFVPERNEDDFADRQLKQLILTHLVIAGFGLLGLGTIYYKHRKLTRRLAKAKRHLQLAYMDVLTQLPNRRYYDFFVNREWKRAKRQGYPLSMIMIDIDYFKIYNDNMGHIQGDRCLKQVAKTLRTYFRRAGDLIARYGGEEFCVVAACDEEQIAQLAEILRKAVEDMHVPHPGSEISDFVTISLGGATVVPNDGMEMEELLRLADQTLYQAKRNGRNRVEIYKPSA